MDFENLTPELKEKAKACETEEELAELAKAENLKLSDDQVEGVAGGTCRSDCTWDGAICRVDQNCVTKR